MGGVHRRCGDHDVGVVGHRGITFASSQTQRCGSGEDRGHGHRRAVDLLGLDEQGGHLGAHGPIPAALARALAFDPNGTWRRLGRFPGCRRDSNTCELDHVLAWADGGLTTVENVHALCPKHHHLKHQTTWQVQRQPDGSTRWTSPTGHSYLQPLPDPLPVDTTMTPRRLVAVVDEAPPF